MMDAARPEPALCDLKPPALTEQNVAGGNGLLHVTERDRGARGKLPAPRRSGVLNVLVGRNSMD